MADIFTEIDELFGGETLPYDETGCLKTLSQFLDGYRPLILIMLDAQGDLVAVEHVREDPAGGQLTAALCDALKVQLESAPECLAPFEGREGLSAFGLRVPVREAEVVVGGLLSCPPAHSAFEELLPGLAAISSLSWFGISNHQRVHESERRITHLLAERDTLKIAHAQTVATVIEEREERIRQQRDYVLHLEEEVEKRSAALREAMKRAQEANEAKSAFLANMSHEIRTPMTAIMGYADVLFESGQIADAPPLRIEAVETIRRNGKYLLDIINDILDLAKVESGKMIVERIETRPLEVLSDVITLMHVRAGQKGLPLLAESEGPIPSQIRTDPTRLRQILVNLVGNAIKFTESGEVRVCVRLKAGATQQPALQFDVIDTGIGLTGQQIAGLFQPFSQADASTTRRHGGTGLGLTLCRKLAQAIDGEVSVDSKYGSGSRFRLTISIGSLDGVKMLQGAAAAIGQSVAALEPEALLRLDCHILLAEDGPDNQRLLIHILQKAGATIEVVDNGQRAVEAALQADDAGQPFDVVLMDMQMPVMDGYEATRMLRDQGYDRPIVALTAHAMAGARSKCLNAGCDEFATKPIDRAILIALIRSFTTPVDG